MRGAVAGRRVLVSGARGFIGTHAVAALAAAGAEVTALLRSGHEAARLRALGARVVVAPLRPGRALARALRGQEAVVHAAHDVRARAAANIAAFRALLEAACQGGSRRFVLLSSAVVYDDWPRGRIAEDAPWGGPGGGDYRQAKIAMERMLLQAETQAVILQPTLVYGPGSALWTEAPLAALRAGGVVLPVPCGTSPLVHVEDVAEAVLRAVAAPGPFPARFVLSGPGQPGWLEVYEGYRAIAGRGEILLRPEAELRARLGPPPVGGGPGVAARLSAALRRVLGTRRFERALGRLRALRPARGPRWPDRHLLELLLAEPEVSIARARAGLGYRPRYDLAAGMDSIRAALEGAGREGPC